MKHIVIVSPHFVPSKLTGVHRARLLSRHLPEFGWKPTIITVHEKFYEEKLDWELCELLPAGLQIRKTHAFATKPIRFVGDIGIRGFWGMYQEIIVLHKIQKIDFLLITIPSNFAALLGPLVKKRLGIPYGIDYQDPWVYPSPRGSKIFSKAWLSFQLAKLFEPIALKKVSLVTGVAKSYYADVIMRNSRLAQTAKVVPIPYGCDYSDFQYLTTHPRELKAFQEESDNFNLVFTGVMPPRGYFLLEAFFRSISDLTQSQPALMDRFRLHFIGTGTSSDDPEGHTILPYIKKYHLEKWVQEYPQKMSYLDALNHVWYSSAILMFGSSDQHYTPSKVFLSLFVGKPILAVLNEESEAADIIKKTGTGRVVTFAGSTCPEDAEIKDCLKDLVKTAQQGRVNNRSKLGEFSCRRSAKILAESINDLAV